MKKKVNRKYIIARLWKYICRYKGLAAAAIFLTITSNVLALIGPALSGEAINAVEPGRGAVDFGRVFFYCAVMAVSYTHLDVYKRQAQERIANLKAKLADLKSGIA